MSCIHSILLALNILSGSGAATATTTPLPTNPPDCGALNIIFTGLPPYHPLVTSQGFDPALINKTLRADAADILKQGYNLRVVLMGPEQPLSVLQSQLDGIAWDGTGIGYGVRGSRLQNLTIRLEDTIQLYHTRAPLAPIVFDYSSNTALWAVQRKFPLMGSCEGRPGRDLGFKVFCDNCIG